MLKQRTIRNILVTGGAGFIGSAFIRYLLQEVKTFQGRCVNFDLLTYAGNLENLKTVDTDLRYFFQQGDICNQALVERVCLEHQIDAIIHFAAESHVDRSILDPKTFLETNVMGTFSLLEVVRKHPRIHFHHVSTDEVYGCLGKTGFFTEETPYHPNSPYSASKASSDHIVRAYAETYKISTCISNCSNNYGPYHFPEKLIPLVILNCLNKLSIPVYGQGDNVRDWLYVEDHAKALWLLLEYGTRGEAYNVGGDSEMRNIDVVHEVLRIFSELHATDLKTLQNLVTFVKDRPGHDYRYAIDCSKLKRELEWKPDHTFEKGLQCTIQWFLDNPAWIHGVQSGAYRSWMQLNYKARL